MVVDMQNDFLTQSFRLKFPTLIPNIRRLLDAARRSKVPVVYTKETHRPGRVDMGSENYPGTGLMYFSQIQTENGSCRVHCVEGTRGVEIVDELAPQVGDYVVSKRRYNAFLGTDLKLLLDDLKIDTILISGILSEVCVLYTAGEAHQLDYYVRLVEDCTAGVSQESTKAAVDIIRGLTTGVQITLETVLNALKETA
jgi:nicotinamidase-related amidase